MGRGRAGKGHAAALDSEQGMRCATRRRRLPDPPPKGCEAERGKHQLDDEGAEDAAGGHPVDGQTDDPPAGKAMKTVSATATETGSIACRTRPSSIRAPIPARPAPGARSSLRRLASRPSAMPQLA